jgi:lipopolysaccharide biosynthesis glycosyltransferase
MYATILVPELFQQPKSIFIDADAIILKPLDDLIVDMHGKACAGTLHETCVSEHVIGWDRKGRGAWTSVVVYDRSAWVKRGIYAKCLQAMNEDKYYFKCHDQSVLNLALNLDWYLFPRDYQLQAGRESTPKLINDAYILHFMGTKPWQEYPLHLQPAPAHKLFARKLWNQYA